jgi:hypothetical protein
MAGTSPAMTVEFFRPQGINLTASFFLGMRLVHDLAHAEGSTEKSPALSAKRGAQ